MEIIDPGHVYSLRTLDSPGEDKVIILTFVKREGKAYPGNLGHYPGTTTQEVLRALIERMTYVDGQIPDPRNLQILYHLRSSILKLEMRAAERHGRVLPAINISTIENVPVCAKCGHIGCEGGCH